MIKNKAIAHYFAKVTGKDPKVLRLENQDQHLDILVCTENGDDQLNVLSTIGLSAHPTNQENRNFELTIVLNKQFELAPNILATCGFKTLMEGWAITTGAVFSHVFGMYYPEIEAKHGLLVPPYLWKDTLKNLDLGDRLVEWKTIIPVTEKEVTFLLDHSAVELLPKFVEQQVDLFDLKRKSVIV